MSPIERSGGGGGGGGGAWTLIASSTLGVAAASFDITGIPAAFNHLYLTVIAHGDGAGTDLNLLARFNNDSAANYDAENLFAQASATGAGPIVAGTSARLGNSPGAGATAASFSESVMRIPFYAQTTADKIYQTLSGRLPIPGTSASYTIEQWEGLWRNTAAINRLTIFPGSGNLVAGSAFTLHGIL